MPRVLLISAFLLFALPGLSAFAAPTNDPVNPLTKAELFTLSRLSSTPTVSPATQDQLLLRADSLQHEQGDDIITASGNVDLQWGSYRLYADNAKYYREKGVIEATGKVRLLKDGDIFTGDSASLQVDSRTGVVANGTIFIKNTNLHLTGKSIEKSSEQDYRIDRGSITSCDGDKPSWRFRVDDLKLTIDDFAYGKNALFYLGDLPVFWFPYLIFPAKTERQSGFLIPQLGYSQKKGAFFELPYYWAITPSQDLTSTLDLESHRGLGLGLEHRYLSSNKGQGNSKGFLFYDWSQGRFRGDLELKQQVNFSDRTYWRADIDYTLDRDFYRDYGTASGDYNRQYTYTNAFLSHSSNSILATVGVDYLTDLYKTQNNTIPQKLPYLTLTGSGERLASSPFYYSFASSLTHFEREQDSRGERLLIAPELTMQGAVNDMVRGRMKLGYYQLGYSAEDTVAANGISADGVVQAAASLRTELSRIYESSSGGFSRFRHLLAPELSYSFTEKKGLNDLPFFDYDDRPAGGQLLTLSLNNVITGRSGKDDTVSYRDLVRFNLSQGYQLSGERRDLLTLVDYGRPFTDTSLVAELMPLSNWRIIADNRISPYNGQVTNSALGVAVGSPAGTHAGLDYHYALRKLDYIEGKAMYADFKPYQFAASARYSFDRPGFLETLYSVEYKHQCWSLLLSYRDRIGNKEFMVTLGLSGLGTFRVL